MTNRITRDEQFMWTARVASQRGTCARRTVGCVIVNLRHHIVGVGWNGPPSGAAHCVDHHCPGADMPSGKGLELCEAVHAEQNALLQCPNVYEIDTVYCTTCPCLHCIKILMNTSARRLVFAEDYAESSIVLTRWMTSKPDRSWLHFKPDCLILRK